jgi:hypothetical protein
MIFISICKNKTDSQFPESLFAAGFRLWNQSFAIKSMEKIQIPVKGEKLRIAVRPAGSRSVP